MKVLAPLFAFFAISTAIKVDTVNELNIDQYSGTWFQMYSNLPVMSTFEKDNVCITAQYSPHSQPLNRQMFL